MPNNCPPMTYRKGEGMTIRYVTLEGSYKIVEVTEVEIEPISNADMQSIKGRRLLIKESK